MKEHSHLGCGAGGHLACRGKPGETPGCHTGKMPVLRLRELLENCFVETNSAFEIFERKILIRRVRAAIRQCESHQKRFDAQNTAELRDYRDTAAFADERDVAVERFT